MCVMRICGPPLRFVVQLTVGRFWWVEELSSLCLSFDCKKWECPGKGGLSLLKSGILLTEVACVIFEFSH
jgi:hypothetical protein